MRRLRLDFLHPLPSTHWVGWLLLAAGIVLAAWVAWRGETVNRSLQAAIAEAPASTQTRRSTAPVASGAANAAVAARDQLAAPWGEFLVRLEASRTSRVALLSLEADARRPEATLTAEARTAKDMFAWIEKLKDEAGFGVVLASHAVQVNDPQQPVRFVVRLRWRR